MRTFALIAVIIVFLGMLSHLTAYAALPSNEVAPQTINPQDDVPGIVAEPRIPLKPCLINPSFPCLQDAVPPKVTVPQDMVVEATSASGAVVEYPLPTATDNRGVTNGPSCSPSSGSTFGITTTTIQCSAEDAAGNVGTATFKIIVQDTTMPSITTPPSPVKVEATTPAGDIISYTVSATDVVDGEVIPKCSPASGSTFTIGKHEINCTATDMHGNSANAKFDVVVDIKDTEKPEITVPRSPLEVEATSISGAEVEYDVTSTDDVDGTITPQCSPASGSNFAITDTTVTCTAIDSSNNTATKSFIVTVQDTKVPSIEIPSSKVEVEATGEEGAAVKYKVTASDEVDGEVIPKCSPASGSTFTIGNTRVTCTATDSAGNTATKSFIVTVLEQQNDSSTNQPSSPTNQPSSPTNQPSSPTAPTVTAGNNPPKLSVPQQPLKAEATGEEGAAVSYDVTSTDDVDGTITPQCSPASGSIFPVGNTTVTCTAIDSSNNTATKSFIVTVQKPLPTANNAAPIANITLPELEGSSSSYQPNQQLIFLADKSSDPDGKIVDYLWNFGDGTATANGTQVLHTYPKEGKYVVTLEVTDDKGAKAKDQKDIVVKMNASAAGLTPAGGQSPEGGTLSNPALTTSISGEPIESSKGNAGFLAGNNLPIMIGGIAAAAGGAGVLVAIKRLRSKKDKDYIP